MAVRLAESMGRLGTETAFEVLDGYERPPLDDDRLAALDEYVAQRRGELGD